MKLCVDCKHSIKRHDTIDPVYYVLCRKSKQINHITGEITYKHCVNVRGKDNPECDNWAPKDPSKISLFFQKLFFRNK